MYTESKTEIRNHNLKKFRIFFKGNVEKDKEKIILKKGDGDGGIWTTDTVITRG